MRLAIRGRQTTVVRNGIAASDVAREAAFTLIAEGLGRDLQFEWRANFVKCHQVDILVLLVLTRFDILNRSKVSYQIETFVWTCSIFLHRYYQPNIPEAVASFHKLEEIWQAHDASSYAIWRFCGLKEGIYRKLPGTRMAPDYDPTLRPWYFFQVRMTTRVAGDGGA